MSSCLSERHPFDEHLIHPAPPPVHGDAHSRAISMPVNVWYWASGNHRLLIFIARHRLAGDATTKCEELVADGSSSDLAAHRRHRRFLRPCPSRSLRLRDGAERRDDQFGGEESAI